MVRMCGGLRSVEVSGAKESRRNREGIDAWWIDGRSMTDRCWLVDWVDEDRGGSKIVNQRRLKVVNRGCRIEGGVSKVMNRMDLRR